MLLNIRHSGIIISNIQGALYFYTELLGLEIIVEGKLDQYDTLKLLGIADSVLHYIRLGTKNNSLNNSSLLELWYFENEKVTEGYFGTTEDEWERFDLNHISFIVDNIDEIYEKLEEEGIHLHCPPAIDAECKSKVFFARDFDDNLLEFVQIL